MDRIALTDGTGRWFDKEAAEEFDEDTYWDGRNRISKATGSQWHHEILYRTASKIWVMCCCSNYQNVATTYEVIEDDHAARWLVENGHEHESVTEAIEALEL